MHEVVFILLVLLCYNVQRKNLAIFCNEYIISGYVKVFPIFVVVLILSLG